MIDSNETLAYENGRDAGYSEGYEDALKELLTAKEAIFKLIAQFHHPTKFEDSEFYMYNYSESALELAFEVLGIEGNYIKLIDWCKMWEDNRRAIWEMNGSNPYESTTADIFYKIFVEEYESWQKAIDYLIEED